MSFQSKNLHTKRRGISFIKGATLFFLGMSCVLFIARAFDIVSVAPNAVQYISKVFLTNNGSNTSATGIILDGTTNGGVTITNLPNKVVLGTDANGKVIASTSGAVYNFISGLLGGSQGTTGIMGTGITSGRVSNGILYLQYSGANGTGIWNVGSVQGPAGATGSIALNCSNGQVAKSNGNTWICGTDELGGAGSNTTNYINTITGMSFNPTNNMLTLYISGASAVTATINLSGVNNWNSAYSRTNTSGTSLWNRYANTGIHMNGLATAPLNCSLGEIPKVTSTGWNCAPDLTGTAGGGTSLWTMAGNDMYNNNRSIGKVGIGLISTPQATLQISGTLIAGPSTNQITSSPNSLIFGINNNITNSAQSHIGGQSGQINSSLDATIAGGENNKIINGTTHSFIGGGYDNVIDSNIYMRKATIPTSGGISSIVGGRGNKISFESSASSIVGGLSNKISTGSDYGFIGGGEINSILSSSHSFIGGGMNNKISTDNPSTSLGEVDYGFIGGGVNNEIANTIRSVIGGGYGNEIKSITYNQATGYSTIPGGYNNKISGASYSFAAGKDAQVFHDNSFLRNSDNDNSFSTTKKGTFIINAPRSDCGGSVGCGGVGIDTNTPAAALDVSGTILGNNIKSKSVLQGNELMADTSVTTPVMNLQPDATISAGASCPTPGAVVYNSYDFYGCANNGSYSVRKKLNN